MLEQKQSFLASKSTLFLRYLLFLIVISLSISLVRSFIKITKADTQIQAVKNKITNLKNENSQLTSQITSVESEFFVEKQARDKLGLAKKGEIVLILPNDIESLNLLSQTEIEDKPEFPKTNFQKWLEIFDF